MSAEETLYRNANIITVDSAHPRASAMIVRDGITAAIGDVEVSARPGAATVDLDGATVIPGFDDCHMHILSMGLGLNQLNVAPTAAPTLADICRAVAERAAVAPPGAWILGRGYNQNLLPEGRHPNRHDLDPAGAGHPVVIVHTSGHVMAVNSAALEAAGIGAGTPDPEGGEIDRDEQATPTGVLKETALRAVRAAIPPPTTTQARDAILAASAVLASEGITSASDAATGQTADLAHEIDAYRDALNSGGLKTRMALMPVVERISGDQPVSPDDFDLGGSPQWLRIDATKIFTDGALTTRTAALREPYAGSDARGLLTWETAELTDRAQTAVARGWRLAAHAIGDAAIEQVLDLFERLGLDALARPRIEHATICDTALIDRMAGIGAVAVLQPEDIAVLGDAYPPALGRYRADNNSPVSWFESAQVPIAFSSDRPVTPGNPLVGVRAAIERMTSSGEVLGEVHRISARKAVGYYTLGSAFATMSEAWKGSLSTGNRADFVVLDCDITTCPPDQITQARVLRTVVDGLTVYES